MSKTILELAAFDRNESALNRIKEQIWARWYFPDERLKAKTTVEAYQLMQWQHAKDFAIIEALLKQKADLKAALEAKHCWDCGYMDPVDALLPCDCINRKALEQDRLAEEALMKGLE